MIFTYVFVGIAFGILIQEAGYSVIWAFLSGLFIYAGSMQIVMVSLMTAGVPLHMIAIMTFFINARHIFYGIGFVDKFRNMGLKYPYMVLTMTDETYSVLCSVKYPEDIDSQRVNFYIALICHLLWVFSCTLGSLLGEILPIDLNGIEFSATAFFIVVCVNQWIEFESHIPAIVGFTSSILFYLLLGADKFLIPSLTISMISLIILKDNVNVRMAGVDYER